MLNNLSIKSKLLLSMILPIIGMIYFASINIIERYNKAEESAQIYKITMLNIKISNLVHELQIERGESSGFISSQGKKFEDKLKEQKNITDEKVNQLIQHLNNFDTKDKDNKFNIFKQELSKKTDNLNILRTQTHTLLLDANSAIKMYSKINSFLLDFIYSTSKYTNNINISATILSYSNFLLAKEKTGIERALVTKMLIDNKEYSINRLKLSNLITLQKNFLKQFFKLAINDKIKVFHKTIHDEKLDNEIKRIENLLLYSSNSYNVKPYYWFKIITKKIEKQNIIAEEFSKQLVKLSKQQKNDASNDMMIYNITAVVILLIAILLFMAIMRNINISVNEIINGILNISKTKITKFEKIDIKTEDEFGTIADTLNNMAETLILKEKHNIQINKEIKEAQKKAILSAKAKTEFLANMSHEIRTPLNAVLGFIDILKEETNGRKSSTYVDIIDSSSKSLLKIIEDILDFSKIESGKLDIDKVDFNAKSEFEVITHLFDAKCSQKNISLSLNLDKNLPQVINTDPLRIKQIISNLLSNAVKFTSNGKKINVNIDYEDNLLNVSVKDQGIGIAKDKQEHIFEAFGQEDSSTTREYGGTGLGLSISSELVKLLGGELKLNSEIGVGSEFYFSIPIIIGEELKIKLDSNIKVDFKNQKILLVEDNKANQLFMKVILKKMNLSFDIADDGVEAVDIYKKSNDKYVVILMDENMPNLDGIGAMKQILEYENQNNLNHTPVVALTANALKGDRERFLEAGMDEYMTKPVDREKLVVILSKFIKKSDLSD